MTFIGKAIQKYFSMIKLKLPFLFLEFPPIKLPQNPWNHYRINKSLTGGVK